MLKKEAFANSLALLAAVVYVVFYILSSVAPAAFEYLFNAQFFGADLAAQVTDMGLGTFVGILIAMVVMSWAMGYLWAWLYNRMAKR